jgi:plasmid stability protein
MSQLFIPQLDDAAEARLRARATRNGRSVEAEVRTILEEAARGCALEEVGTSPLRASGQPLGELMYGRFKDRGLTDDEFVRFAGGIFEINDRSAMRIPDLEADAYEETPAK